MKKLNNIIIRKLGYPLWFSIIFFILTVVTPIGFIIAEGLKAPSTTIGNAFKVSFLVFSIGIICWFFVRKFLLSNIETKLLTKQIALEHDYSIKVGDAQAIKYLWYSNQTKLALFNLVNVVIYGGFIVIVMLGVASALIKIKDIVLLITILYIAAYGIKFIILILGRDTNV